MTVTIPTVVIQSGSLPVASTKAPSAAPTAVVVTPPAVIADDVISSSVVDNSNKIIIIWQKSAISAACKQALATVTGGVHIWDPTIDGSKYDGPTFAASSTACLILWAGDPSSKTAATDVHSWYTANRAYIKSTGFTVYVIPKKFFSLAGLKSVYEDSAVAIKALPKWHPDLQSLLTNFEAKFPSSEFGYLTALYNKLLSIITSK